uniref:Uncharacterized protein n=1 Tax=Glossina pallidipes TaxID=7398 RepID=A0A1A9ZS00_GLOPL
MFYSGRNGRNCGDNGLPFNLQNTFPCLRLAVIDSTGVVLIQSMIRVRNTSVAKLKKWTINSWSFLDECFLSSDHRFEFEEMKISSLSCKRLVQTTFCLKFTDCGSFKTTTTIAKSVLYIAMRQVVTCLGARFWIFLKKLEPRFLFLIVVLISYVRTTVTLLAFDIRTFINRRKNHAQYQQEMSANDMQVLPTCAGKRYVGVNENVK